MTANITDTFTIVQPGKRMEWLDAMRGVAMLMVIYCHQVLNYSIGEDMGSVDAVGIFMLAIFFFISGFLSANSTWRGKIRKISKLCGRLLLPTLSVMVLWALIHGDSMSLMLSDHMKHGFWFLITLFMIDVFGLFLFSSVAKFGLAVKVSLFVGIIILDKVLMSVLFRYGVFHYPVMVALQVDYFFMFLIPFIVGAMTKYAWTYMWNVFDNRYGFAVLLACFVGLCFAPFSLVGFILPSIGTLVLFVCMERYKNVFSSCTFVGRCLIRYGRNTLGLYLLHYLVLVYVINGLGPYILIHFGIQQNILAQIIVLGATTIATMELTMMIIKVIELSPVLSMLLLGQRANTKVQMT